MASVAKRKKKRPARHSKWYREGMKLFDELDRIVRRMEKRSLARRQHPPR